ncbi:MAG TPA: hypothetical protein VGK73_36450 [Polyangiaceae bacterium]
MRRSAPVWVKSIRDQWLALAIFQFCMAGVAHREGAGQVEVFLDIAGVLSMLNGIRWLRSEKKWSES